LYCKIITEYTHYYNHNGSLISMSSNFHGFSMDFNSHQIYLSRHVPLKTSYQLTKITFCAIYSRVSFIAFTIIICSVCHAGSTILTGIHGFTHICFNKHVQQSIYNSFTKLVIICIARLLPNICITTFTTAV